jgi:hypothetical protein
VHKSGCAKPQLTRQYRKMQPLSGWAVQPIQRL